MLNTNAHPLEPKYRMTRLLVTHYHVFHKIALAKLRNPTDAEDAVQETCLRIAKYYAGHLELEPEDRLMGYIKLTLHHIALGIRAKRVRNVTVPLDELLYELPAPEDDFEQHVLPREALERILKTVHLSQKARSILTYKWLYNQTTEEVAGLLGMQQSAVRTAFHRAKRQIREALIAEMEKGAEYEKTRV